MRVMFSKKLQNEEEEDKRERRVQKAEEKRGGKRKQTNKQKNEERKFNKLQRNLRSKENKIRYQLLVSVVCVCVCRSHVCSRAAGAACSDNVEAPGGATAHYDEYSHCGLP